MQVHFRDIAKILILTGVLTVINHRTFAQSYPSQEEFGKNRVQLKRFNWKVFRTSNFEVYHYQGGTQLATQAAQMAELEFDRITEFLGYTPYNRIKIFLYNSPGDLEQSNMGLATFGDLEEKELDLAQSRLEIAFTGDQNSFRKKLVTEISRLFVFDMLYGGNLKDALQSSLLLTLPDWFMSGIATYIGEGWTPELSDYMRDAIQNDLIKKPGLTKGTEATVVGQSIWNYIVEKYGEDNVSNILNLTRIIRTEQTSITKTLGLRSYNKFLKDWRDYYAGQAKDASQYYKQPTADWQRRMNSSDVVGVNASIKISPDKKWLAYSELHKGRYRVQTFNLETGKRMILKTGKLAAREEQKAILPLIGWTKYNTLAILLEEGEKQQLYVYDKLDTRRPKVRTKRLIRGLDQIVDMDVAEDGSMLAVSADKGGRNDIYLISVARASVIPLTNDVYDDISPKFIAGSSRRVVFASNRPTDSLKVEKKEVKAVNSSAHRIFEHDGSPKMVVLKELVGATGGRMVPISASEQSVFFLSDSKQIMNVFRADRGSNSVSQVTNHLYGIRSAALATAAGSSSLAYTYLNDGKLVFAYQNNLNTNASLQIPSLTSNTTTNRTGSVAAPVAETKKDSVQPVQAEEKLVLKEGEVDTDNYTFNDDVLKTYEYRGPRNGISRNSVPTVQPKNRRRENIAVKGPFNYKGLFIVNDASSNWRIDPIKGFGFAQSVSMNDLLENHVIKAGFFLPTSFRSNEMFAEYHNYTNRIDFSVRFDRNSLYRETSSAIQKYRYNKLQILASYPFSQSARISFGPAYTSTKLVKALPVGEDNFSQYGGYKAEFVFDNTKINGMNMIEGTRFKARYDDYRGLSRASDSFTRFTVDARHYQKLHRDLILAIRGSYSHSGGRAPKQSILGGMENWVTNRKDASATSDNPIDFRGADNRDIFFTEFATNLRGFNMNRLAGTSFMLFNAELRIPLIKYIYRGPITSNFLKNFQLIAFGDMGTAWTGKGPFSQENSLNTQIISDNPWRATVTNFKSPFLMGYGAGVRTTLFGFYVKLDYAWGVDNGIRGKGIPYVTLGYDF